MRNPHDPIVDFTDKVTLERIQVHVQCQIDKFGLAIRDIELGAWLDSITGNLTLSLRAYVLGETQKPIELPAYPLSWWQMFKRDVMPRWFVKRWPVRSRIVTIEAKTLYPDLKVSIPARSSRVVVVFQKSPSCF